MNRKVLADICPRPIESSSRMSQTKQEQIDWTKVLEQAGPYPLDAFQFVRDGLNYTARREHDDYIDLPDHDRHITGQQLCIGLRDFAIESFGLLAPEVLNHWNIHRTDDFGRIVFAMIDVGLFSKTPDDSLDDFRAVYDFDEAFCVHELARTMTAVAG